MNEMTTFVVYNEKKDASLVVDLLKRNKYFLGRLDKNLNVDSFLEYQQRRSYEFAVVAKYDNKVIGHIAAYKSGNQGVAKDGELYLSTAIVDHAYQRFMPSIGQLYFLAMEELIKRGYRVAISDVFRTNMASMYMLRRFRYVLTNSEPNMYDNFLLRNYMPVIFMALCLDNIGDVTENIGSLFTITNPINKQEARIKDSVIDGKYVKQTLIIEEKNFNFYINIFSQYVCKLSIEDFVTIEPLKQDLGYSIIAFDKFNVEISIYNFTGDCSKRIYALEEADKVDFTLSENIERVHFRFDSINASLQLFPKKNLEESQVSKLEVEEDIFVDLETGYLKYTTSNKNLITEMWPCFSRPFLYGYLEPRKFELKYSKIDKNNYLLYEKKENYIIYREYSFEDKNTIIHSYVDVREKTIVEPIMHIAFDDFEYTCTIITENETITKNFSKKDKSYCNEEMIYEYFGNEEYTKSVLKEIIVTFPDAKFRISPACKMYCFYQFNYICFRFSKPSEVFASKITAENERVDLGSIKIENIS